MKTNVADIKRVIKDIEKLNFDLGCLDRRATPDIVGFYGELLVWKELKSRFGWQGYTIDLGRGQSRADMVMEKNGNGANIEVKTSRLKEGSCGKEYSFAINIKKCKKHKEITFRHPKREIVHGCFCYFDFLIAVLLSDDFKKKEFYVFPRSFIEKKEKSLRNTSTRFSSHTHGMRFLVKPKDSKCITGFDHAFVKGKFKYKNKWRLIK